MPVHPTYLLALLVLWLGTSLNTTYAQSLYVAAIIDGERLVLSDGSRVQLVGVDAIEKFSAAEVSKEVGRLGVDDESVRAKGGIAASYVSVLLKSRYIQVNYQESQIEGHDEGNPNDYKPVFISVLNENGWFDFVLNKKIIEDGYAFVDPKTPEALKAQFLALQKDAMQQGRGLWALNNRAVKVGVRGVINPSQNADIHANCRSVEGCVWVSGEDPAIGFWRSSTGYRCPCAK